MGAEYILGGVGGAGSDRRRGKGAQSIGSVSRGEAKAMTGAYASALLGKVQRLPGTRVKAEPVVQEGIISPDNPCIDPSKHVHGLLRRVCDSVDSA
jgi:hypothetical protein